MWFSTDRNLLWFVIGETDFLRDRDKDCGISVSSSNTVSQHLLVYWSTWVPPPSALWEERFHLSHVFVYLLFIHWNWHLWVRGVFWACARRGVATADPRARQGKFFISWHGRVSAAQQDSKYDSFILKERAPSEKTFKEMNIWCEAEGKHSKVDSPLTPCKN